MSNQLHVSNSVTNRIETQPGMDIALKIKLLGMPKNQSPTSGYVNALIARVVLDGKYLCLIFGKKPHRLLLGTSRSARVKITLTL